MRRMIAQEVDAFILAEKNAQKICSKTSVSSQNRVLRCDVVM
jgi:hypothetical protein